MHPSIHAKTNPDKPAYIMAGSGETVTYAELDARSNQGAHLFRSLGVRAGDSIALFIDNSPAITRRSGPPSARGVRYTAISSKLTAGEVEYIVKDCGAKALIAGKAVADVGAGARAADPGREALHGRRRRGPIRELRGGALEIPEPRRSPTKSAGGPMLYSSGTTGRPKGVRSANAAPAPADRRRPTASRTWDRRSTAGRRTSIYLSPAPLYHAAPLGWSMAMQALGGTVIVMERFDAEDALRCIEDYKVTTAQWVPTHFVRMLKLPPEVRANYDVSSLTQVFHAAAPCPIPIKEQMIAWWGPIISEYYAGTEGNGFTAINCRGVAGAQGLGRPRADRPRSRSATRTASPCRPARRAWSISPAAASSSTTTTPRRPRRAATGTAGRRWAMWAGWTRRAILYLTDRKSFMIISGGVNIYPQEIENLLDHPSQGRRRRRGRRAARGDGRAGGGGGPAGRLGRRRRGPRRRTVGLRPGQPQPRQGAPAHRLHAGTAASRRPASSTSA